MKKVLGLLAMALLLVGCGSLNKENYDKIKLGMAYAKVVDVLGTPDQCEEAVGLKNCVWGNDSKHIKIGFIADKVTASSSKGIK